MSEMPKPKVEELLQKLEEYRCQDHVHDKDIWGLGAASILHACLSGDLLHADVAARILSDFHWISANAADSNALPAEQRSAFAKISTITKAFFS